MGPKSSTSSYAQSEEGNILTHINILLYYTYINYLHSFS